MPRISDELSIHREGSWIVLIWEPTGFRMVFPVAQAREVLRVLAYLATDPEPASGQ
jgi:hypothetical protein